jgi:type IV/VI secretion system ImpK/VasF family protein
VTHALWEIVLATWDDVSRVLSTALPPGTASGPGVGAAILDPLRAAIHDRLDALERDLAARVGEPEAKRVVFPLILHLDERVLLQLPRSDKLAWHRLQDDVLTDEAGGEVFYARLDLLLRLLGMDQQSIVLEVYYFCLADGFHGRFDDDAAIDHYKREIKRHLGVPAGPVPGTAIPAVSPRAAVHPRRSPAFYYTVTAVLVVLILALPIALSNLL